MKFKKIIFNILLFAIIFILVGCNLTFYTVTFESNGGSEVTSKQTIGYVARPTDPTKEGLEFAGWYLDSELTNEFSFKDKISENITLYAKWVTPSDNGGSGDSGNGSSQGGGNNQGGTDNPSTPSQTNYTVTFESNGGSTIENKTTVDGKISAPNNPERDHYNFEGWYKDADLTTPFDFNSTITANIILYAKWVHIDDTSYFEGTFSSETIDPYILAMDLSSRTIANADDYALYLDYGVLNKLDSITLTMQNTISSNEEFSAFVSAGMQAMKIESTCHFNFSIDGNKLTTLFEFPEMATTSASDTNQYVQVPFVCEILSRVSKDHTSFKIDQVTNTYLVTDSDQLCYVLERGYKPTFASDECSAKRMYDAARLVLSSIVDDNYTDIEKLHAIYDWLIENVTYDKTLFGYVLANGDDLRKYKGFYLEGVFDDHRAVCDGISKAFMVMARIEGIECVQVIGTAVSSGVGHAWNKVRLNGRWYIVDATGGGVVVGGEKEMLTHRLFMCNDAYYSTNYTASIFTNLVADSEYSIYRDLKYTYKGTNHDYYIDDVDELADILSYYKSLGDNSKTIDFYYAGENVASAIQSAMQKAHISGSYSTIQNDGSIIFKLN